MAHFWLWTLAKRMSNSFNELQSFGRVISKMRKREFNTTCILEPFLLREEK
jgi:hypothetical protein